MPVKTQRPRRQRGSRRQNLRVQLAQLEESQLLRQVIDEEPAYIFRHTLTQESAYDSLLKNQRREIHRAVGEAYEQVYADRCMDEFAAILARHYAEAGDDSKTLEYATHAGNVAARVYANTEAIAFYTQALEIARQREHDTAQLIALGTQLGRVYELAEDYPHAIELYRDSYALGQARGDRKIELDALMLQATAFAVGLGTVRNLRQATEISMQALELAQELDDRKALARIYWNLLLSNRFGNEGPEKAIEYGEKSLELARGLGMTEQVALTLKDLTIAYVVAGKLEYAKARRPEIIQLWRQLNNKPMLAEAMGGASQSFFSEGRLDDAQQMGEEAYAINQSISNRYGLCITGSFLWYVFRERGELQHAISLAEQAIAIAEELDFVGGPAWGALVELAATYVRLGDLDRARELAQRALATVTPDAPSDPLFPAAVLASVALHEGKLTAAEEWLAPYPWGSFDKYFRMNPGGITDHINVFIELALAQKNPDRALKIADEAIDSMRGMGILIQLPSLAHLKAKALSMLGRAEEAYALLEVARKQAEDMQSRYQLLPILLTLMEMNARSNERSNAAQSERRGEARRIVQFIFEHTPSDLRESFVALPEIQRVLAE